MIKIRIKTPTKLKRTAFGSKTFGNTVAGADPGFLLGGGAPLRNDVTIQDFPQEGVHL